MLHRGPRTGAPQGPPPGGAPGQRPGAPARGPGAPLGGDPVGPRWDVFASSDQCYLTHVTVTPCYSMLAIHQRIVDAKDYYFLSSC